MLFFLLLLLLLLFPLLLPLLPLLVLKPNHYTIALHLFTITRLLVASLFFSFSPPPPPFLRRSIHLIEESKFLWARSVAPILSIVLPQTSHSLFLFFSFPLWMIFTRTFQPPSFTSLIFLPSIRSFPSPLSSHLGSSEKKKEEKVFEPLSSFVWKNRGSPSFLFPLSRRKTSPGRKSATGSSKPGGRRPTPGS